MNERKSTVNDIPKKKTKEEAKPIWINMKQFTKIIRFYYQFNSKKSTQTNRRYKLATFAEEEKKNSQHFTSMSCRRKWRSLYSLGVCPIYFQRFPSFAPAKSIERYIARFINKTTINISPSLLSLKSALSSGHLCLHLFPFHISIR